MANVRGGGDATRDMFGDTRIPGPDRSTPGRTAPELIRARVLCRRLRRQPARADKMRTAHLICLNLLSMLRQAEARG